MYDLLWWKHCSTTSVSTSTTPGIVSLNTRRWIFVGKTSRATPSSWGSEHLLFDLLHEHRPRWTEGQELGILFPNEIRPFVNPNQPYIMRLSCHKALPNRNMLLWVGQKTSPLPHCLLIVSAVASFLSFLFSPYSFGAVAPSFFNMVYFWLKHSTWPSGILLILALILPADQWASSAASLLSLCSIAVLWPLLTIIQQVIKVRHPQTSTILEPPNLVTHHQVLLISDIPLISLRSLCHLDLSGTPKGKPIRCNRKSRNRTKSYILTSSRR